MKGRDGLLNKFFVLAGGGMVPRFCLFVVAASLIVSARRLYAAEVTVPRPVAAEAKLDGYGCAMTVQEEARNRFSVQKIHDRWWFVTPEGHSMVSLGIVHILRYWHTYEQFRSRFGEDVPAFLKRG